jgi:hypothetical protein
MSHMFNHPVRPEPVEGLSFFVGAGEKEKQGFDKLSPNGSCGDFSGIIA